uniref:hypothetical protein n=1 Tax=Neorhizobium sp. EC2-8 TaxID=3129230 RepID=UPI003101637C
MININVAPYPHILLYARNPIASRLGQTLAEQAFSVTTATDQREFVAALEQDRYWAIVTGTAHVREVRIRASHPIINYEIFIHSVPQTTNPSSDNRPYFDAGEFIKRVRSHAKNPAAGT